VAAYGFDDGPHLDALGIIDLAIGVSTATAKKFQPPPQGNFGKMLLPFAPSPGISLALAIGSERMTRLYRFIALAMLPAWAVGCTNLQPAMEFTPLTPIMGSAMKDTNPVFIPLPAREYGRVFETALQVLGDYGFDIIEPNRYSGHIEAAPRIAPGVAQLLKPGSPDCYERFLASFQTYRHRVSVVIQTADANPADHGGYFVEFIVRKELEDLPRPIRSAVGSATFRSENTVERQTEVIDPTYFDPTWIYRGRDTQMEQELIRRFKNAL
jgi:hypothetical protein